MSEKLLLVVLFLLISLTLKAQIKIGDQPELIHSASVLELQSSNKVLVITRLTDSEMNALEPLAGALVYNTDQDCVFQYDGSIWTSLCNASGGSAPLLNNGSNVIITGTGVVGNPYVVSVPSLDDADADATNEIQDLSLTGNNLSLTNDPTATPIDLSTYLDDTDDQTLSITGNTLSIADGNSVALPTADGSETVVNAGTNANVSGTGTSGDPYVVSVPSLDDADADATNEIQDISTDNTAGNISLSSGSTLTLNVDDADADSTNEIQDLSLTGNDLSLTNDPTATPIDLSTYLDDTDDQTLSITGNTLSIADGNSVALPTADGSETVVNAGTNANVSGTGTSGDPYVVSVPSLDDADADASNEIQDLSLTGNDLSLTNDPTATPIDLSTYLDDTDDQTLSITGNTLSIADGNSVALPTADGSETVVNAGTNANVTGTGTTGDPYVVSVPSLDDADADATNEIQDLSLTGNDLSLTNDPTATPIDLSTYLDDTDDQTLSITGNTLSIADGNSVALPTADGSETVVNAGTNANVTGTGTTGDPYVVSVPSLDDADADATNEIQDITTDNTAGNISLSSGSTLTLNVDDADADTTNEIQDLSLTGNDLSLTNDPTATPIDLSTYLDDTDDQTLSITGNTLSIADGNSVALPTADGSETVVNAGTNANVTGTGTSGDPYVVSVPSLDDADADATNEIQDITTDNTAGNISLSSGSTLTLNVDDADADSTNEIQDLSLTGNDLNLTNDPTATPIDLSTYLDDTDDQTLSITGNTLSIADGNSVALPTADGSETVVNAGTNANVTGTGTSGDPYVVSVPSLDDADADATNEIQDLSLTGNDLSLTNDPTATPIDLSTYLDDTDDQTLSITGNTLSIADGNSVALPTADGSETVVNAGTNANVSGTGTTGDPYVVSVPSLDDADADSTNEIQDLSLTGNDLSLTNDPTATPIDLSTYLDDTDDQTLSITGNTLSIADGNSVALPTADGSETVVNAGTNANVSGTGTSGDPYVVSVPSLDDADADSTNEIQDLSLTGNDLSLTNDPTATPIDLSTYLDDTDDQTLSITGNTLSIADGNSVALPTADGSETVVNAGTNANVSGTGTTGDPYVVSVPSLDDADADSTNEIQDLSLTGNDLSLTNDPTATPIDLSTYLDDTDDQTLSITGNTLSIADGNSVALPIADGSETVVNAGTNANVSGTGTTGDPYVVSVPTLDDADADPSNEIQDISTDNTAGDISLSSGSTLTLNVDDADADATNEIQDLSLTGNDLSLTNDPTATPIDLSTYLDDTDDQTLSITGNTLFIADGNSVALPTADGSETVVNAGTNANVSGTGTSGDPYVVSVPSLDDADADASNEIQDISTDNTAGNISLSSGSTLTLNVDDADADATNEIQDLSLTGNDLSLTNDPTATPIDLSTYLDDTDDQTLSITGNTLSIADGNSVALPTADGSETVVNAGTNANVTGTGTTGDPYVVSVPSLDDADADVTNEIQDISTDNTAGNISLSSGSTLTLNVDDADADSTNEIQDLSLTGNDLSLTNDPTATPIDLSTYLDDTDDQTLSITGNTLSIADGNSVALPTADGSETVVNAGTNANVTGTGTTGDPYVVSVPSLDDADADATNEIQDITTDNTAGNISLSSGSTLTLNVDDADADTTNEIQDLSLTGNDLSLTNDPTATPIDLSTYLDDTDDQTLSITGNTLSIADGNSVALPTADGSETVVNAGTNANVTGTGTTGDPYVVSVPSLDDADADATNEIQDISTDNTAGNISLSSGSTLTLNVDDADADSTNEIQDLSLTGNDLSLTNDPTATPIDLSTYLDDTDDQTLSITGNTLSIADGNSVALPTADGSETVVNAGTNANVTGTGTTGDPYVVSVPSLDDADADATNEIQDITTDNTAGNISLSSGSTLTLNVDDADADSTNEIQDLSLTGNDLSLTNDPTATPIDLSTYLDDTDDQTLSITGNTLSIADGNSVALPTADGSETVVNAGTNANVSGTGTTGDPYVVSVPTLDDADADATNEIQDLSLTGNDLSLTNDPTATPIDLSTYLDDTDDQTLSITGNTLSIADGNSVALPIADGSETVVNAGTNANVTGTGTTGDPYVVSVPSLDDADADVTNEIQDITTDNTAGNISLSSGSTLTLNVDDADADVTNEIQDLSLTGNDLSLTNDPTATPIDLSTYLDDTDDQTLSITGNTLSIADGNSVALPSADGSETVVNAGTNANVTGTGTIGDPYVVSVPTLDDADADVTNEIQDITTDNTAGNISLSSGSTLTLNVDDADADTTNEIQDLSLTGNDLSLTNDPTATPIDLSTYLDDTDDQTLSITGNTLSIADGNSVALPTADGSETVVNAGTNANVTGTGTTGDPYVVSVPSLDDADADATNEIQDISTDNTAGNISLSSGSTLTLNVDDADADSTNEIQDLSLTGNDLSLTNDPTATPIDLSTYLDDTDDQTLSITGNTLSIADGNSVALPTADGSETVVNAGTNANVSGTGTSGDPYVVSVPSLDDADADASNEIQDLSLTGNDLSLTNDPTATPIDLSTYLDDTDDQTLSITGNTLSIADGNSVALPTADGSETVVNAGTNANVSGTGTSGDPYVVSVPSLDDADADASNEIQDISTDNTAGNISLSSGSTLTLNVDDADADSTNEIQDLSLTGNDLSLTNDPTATPIDLSTYLDDTDDQTLSITGNTLSIADGNSVALPTADGSETVVNAGTNANVTGTGTSGDPYVVSVPSLDDADADSTNEIQDLSLTGNDLSLTNDPTATPIDLSTYLDDTDDQTLSITGNTLSIADGNSVALPTADGSETVVNAGTNANVTGTGTTGDPYVVSVPSLDDADADATNEIQDITTDNTAGNISLSSGSTLTLNVDDADADSTNEIQDLSQIGRAHV